MKMVLAGLGEFGSYWLHLLKKKFPHLKAVVADTDPAAADKLKGSGVPFYASIEGALRDTGADFVLNATPPDAHEDVNSAAFDLGVPVLCENPIAGNFDAAVRSVYADSWRGLPGGVCFPACR